MARDLADRLDDLRRRFADRIDYVEYRPEPEPQSKDDSMWSDPDLDSKQHRPHESAPDSPRREFLDALPEQEGEPVPAANGVKVRATAGLQFGQEAPAVMEFVAWKIVTEYPRNWIGKTNRPRCKPWFDTKLDIFSWDIFFLYHPEEITVPLLFVPVDNFVGFLEHVNSHLYTQLRIPLGERAQEFFNMKFGADGSPRPRYLGYHDHTITECPPVYAFELLINTIPPYSEDDKAAYGGAAAAAKESLRDKFRLIKKGGHGDGAMAKKNKSKTKELVRANMMANVCEYLGRNATRKIDASVVFVSVDIECLEMQPSLVSEVGLSFLALRDVVASHPGEETVSGEAGNWRGWAKYVKAHHLRVAEHMMECNHKFVAGCPDRFNFGTSEFTPESDIRKRVGELIAPYCEETKEGLSPGLILVGHDVKNDVRLLEACSVNLGEYPIMGTADTKDMHQYWRGADQGASLGAVLYEMGIEASNLHNAGNDAYYTLQAILGLAFNAPTYGKTEEPEGETRGGEIEKPEGETKNGEFKEPEGTTEVSRGEAAEELEEPEEATEELGSAIDTTDVARGESAEEPEELEYFDGAVDDEALEDSSDEDLEYLTDALGHPAGIPGQFPGVPGHPLGIPGYPPGIPGYPPGIPGYPPGIPGYPVGADEGPYVYRRRYSM